MFSTKAAQSLKNLFASYHEPAPLSKQQSQKLLDGLKSSFRKQLDQEYGQSSDNPTASAETTNPPHRMSATNRHLKDILSNPLFSYEKNTKSTLPSISPSPKSDPLRVFDNAVARGMMTPKAAIGCMIAKSKQLQASSSASNTFKPSGTASRVISWLRSSGMEKDLAFLDNQQFIRTLTPFIIADGMDSVAWEWLSRTINDTTGQTSDAKRLKRASYLLSHMVQTRCQPQNGDLDAGISTMLQAQQMFRDSPLLSELLYSSWISVSWLSTVGAYSHAVASEKLFDAHMATAGYLSKPLLVERAHLHLHHPTHPDHVPALQFFGDTATFRSIAKPSSYKKANVEKIGVMSSWLACLGHDTVNYLIQSGRTHEAQEVTELLQAEVPGVFDGNLKLA